MMFLETLKKTALASCMGLGLMTAQAQVDDLPSKGRTESMITLPAKQLYNSQIIYEAKEAELKNFLLQGWRYDRRKNCLSTGSYSSNTDVKAISKPFTVPALAKGEQLYLNITEAFSLESDYDFGKVLISADGGQSWRSVHTVTGTSDQRTAQVNISSFAGKTLEVALQLTSDASFESTGWQVYDLSFLIGKTSSGLGYNPIARSGANQEIKITGIHDENFPEAVYVDFEYKENSANITDLTLNDLNVDYFGDNSQCPPELYGPDSTGTGRALDILFIIDNSGSMSSIQDDVIDNIQTFTSGLSGNNDVRLGMLRFGQYNSPIEKLELLDQQVPSSYFTPDANYFEQELDSRNIASGSIERGYEAMKLGLSADFRQNAQKVFVFIVNENATGQNLGATTKNEIIGLLNAEGVTVYSWIPNSPSYDNTYADVSAQTGGDRYNIGSTFDGLGDLITQSVLGTYTLRYCPSQKTIDGKERCVEIALDADPSVKDKECFVPYPDDEYIVRQASTKTQSESAEQQYVDLDFCFQVLDNNDPRPTSVDFYYRNLDVTTSYNVLSMTENTTTPADERTWCVTVPGTDVEAPGLSYYAVANYADGHQLKSPPVRSEYFAWSQPVLPNKPPLVTDSTTDIATKCQDLDLKFNVIDSTNYIQEVTLFHKRKGALNYTTVPVYSYSGGTQFMNKTFTITIPIVGDTTEYYIQASDQWKTIGQLGYADAPVKVAAADPVLVGSTPDMELEFTNMTFGCSALQNGDVINAYYQTACGSYALGGSYTVNTSDPYYSVFINQDDTQPGKAGFAPNERITLELVRNGQAQIIRKERIKFQAYGYYDYDVAEQATSNLYVRYNTILVQDGDITPSQTEGTFFKDVTSATTHTFDLQAGSCDPSVEFIGAADYIIDSNHGQNFIVTYDDPNQTLDVQFNATVDDSTTIVVYTRDGKNYYFDVKGTVGSSSCAAELYYNSQLIPDGDATPSISEGTDYDSVSTATTHTFDMVLCSGISITGVSSNSSEFTPTYSGTEVYVEYSSNSNTSGTITVNLSDGSDYTFDVKGAYRPCFVGSVFPNPVAQGNYTVAELRLNVDVTSSVTVTDILLQNPYTVTPVTTTNVDDKTFNVLIPNTLSAGLHTLSINVSNPDNGCGSGYSINFMVNP